MYHDYSEATYMITIFVINHYNTIYLSTLISTVANQDRNTKILLLWPLGYKMLITLAKVEVVLVRLLWKEALQTILLSGPVPWEGGAQSLSLSFSYQPSKGAGAHWEVGRKGEFEALWDCAITGASGFSLHSGELRHH